MTDANELTDILDLERIELDMFRGVTPPEERSRIYGGQVVAQALTAAYRTIEERICASLHAYFICPGDPRIPIIFDVDRIRDGRSFTTRRVVAIQHGRAIFNLSASFHVPEDGPEHQYTMRDAPDPDSLPTMRERLFTAAELAYVTPKADPVPSLAARFAAREAVMKSMGVGLGAFGFHEPAPS